jgi:hypothetical protein
MQQGPLLRLLPFPRPTPGPHWDEGWRKEAAQDAGCQNGGPQRGAREKLLKKRTVQGDDVIMTSPADPWPPVTGPLLGTLPHNLFRRTSQLAVWTKSGDWGLSHSHKNIFDQFPHGAPNFTRMQIRRCYTTAPGGAGSHPHEHGGQQEARQGQAEPVQAQQGSRLLGLLPARGGGGPLMDDGAQEKGHHSRQPSNKEQEGSLAKTAETPRLIITWTPPVNQVVWPNKKAGNQNIQS